MPKAGEEYQELTALVAKALDPDANIKTGIWVEGPDGDREVDVEVRGTVDGVPHFIHIECKDWSKRPGNPPFWNLVFSASVFVG